MLLTLDIGNTEITAGLFRGAELLAHWRMTTNPGRTPDEWGSAVGGFILGAGHSPNEVRAVCLASVAPGVTQALVDGIARVTGCSGIQIDARSPLPIQLDVEEPLTVGADRIINTLAASRIYRRDTIVVDLGTATTYDCITKAGVFLGGVIAPGVRTSAETLFRRTSKLPATEIVPPARVIGRRTEECIQSGVVLGSAEAIDGLVRRIKAEWPGEEVPLVVATGGLAAVFQPFCKEFDLVDPHLTLTGLRIAHDLVSAAT